MAMQHLLGVAVVSDGTTDVLDAGWSAWLTRAGLGEERGLRGSLRRVAHALRGENRHRGHFSRSLVVGPDGRFPERLTQDGRLALSLIGTLRATQVLSARISEAGGDSHGLGPEALLLEGFRLLGEEAASLVGGDWVCLVHDREAGAMACLRSPEASRPLLYLATEHALWVCSDPALLRSVPGVSGGLDHESVSYFLSYGFPPAGRTFVEGVSRLPAGAVLRAKRAGIEPERPIPSLSARAGSRTLDEAATTALASLVAGRSVAILEGADDPRSAWLAEIALKAGATRIAPPIRLPDGQQPMNMRGRLERAERASATLGLPLADPSLPGLALAAEGMAAEGMAAEGMQAEGMCVDLCLCAAGSTAILPGAERHTRFAQALSWLDGSGSATTERSYHEGPLLKRDLYFREIAIFDDAARLAIAGPALACWNVLAMADELGPSLEEATHHTAPALAARIDRGLVDGARLGLDAVSLAAGIRVASPFLADPVLDWAEQSGAADTSALAERFRAWPSREPGEAMRDGIATDASFLRERLHALRFARTGLVGETAVEALLAEAAAGANGAELRLWALCCLDAWLGTMAESRG